MKNLVFLIWLSGVFLFLGTPVNSQVKVDVEKKVEKKVDQRAEKKTDEVIDKGLDKLEQGIGKLFGKKKKKDRDAEGKETEEVLPGTPGDNVSAGEALSGQSVADAGPALNWAKYDFVPGDKVIFEDNLEGEENGEFPSRWDLHEGTAEVAVFGGENVIMFREYGSSIIPYMKNSNADYLPEVFTVEMDAY